MLSSLLHDDDDFEANPTSSNARTGGVASKRPVRDAFTRRIGYQFEWWHVVVGVLVLFPYISIFVLFGLVGNQDATEKNVSGLTCGNVSSNCSASTIQHNKSHPLAILDSLHYQRMK